MNFWDEYQRLILELPVKDLNGFNNTDSLVDESNNCDNCYMCFYSGSMVNCAYSDDGGDCTDCVDLDASGNCENSRMGWGYKCNSCSYFTGDNLVNCHFCFSCSHCQDCFGCAHLEHQQFCFFNKKMTKDQYEKAVEEYKKDKTDIQILEDLKKLAEKYPLPPVNVHPFKEANSDYSDDCVRIKNSYFCFDAYDSQNILYCTNCFSSNDSMDLSYCSKCENCYNSANLFMCNSTSYSNFSGKLLDCAYCYYCTECQDCLGCAGLHGKKYCVLNRQVTKEKYEEIRGQILKNPNIDVLL